MGITFKRPGAEIFIPDGVSAQEALARTTLLGVGAHQDDLEFMAAPAILQAYGRENEWFTGVIVTDGSGSARSGPYAQKTDKEMMRIRKEEQREAARIGKYSAVIQLNYPSSIVKKTVDTSVIGDLRAILRKTKPKEVYTHNIADKHDTHVAVALRLISALRRLRIEDRPMKLVGCPVWRDLDWMFDDRRGRKVIMPIDAPHARLAWKLMRVFDSQIAGGKRYDRATLGRRWASATYRESHEVDDHTQVVYGMDMTPLVYYDDDMEPSDLLHAYINDFFDDVYNRLRRLGGH